MNESAKGLISTKVGKFSFNVGEYELKVVVLQK